jgi:ATP-dependent DNA ligase
LRGSGKSRYGVTVPFPGFVAPALATAVDTVPKGTRWIHEIKFDGYRVRLRMPAEDGYRCAPPILRATAIKVRNTGRRD